MKARTTDSSKVFLRSHWLTAAGAYYLPMPSETTAFESPVVLREIFWINPKAAHAGFLTRSSTCKLILCPMTMCTLLLLVTLTAVKWQSLLKAKTPAVRKETSNPAQAAKYRPSDTVSHTEMGLTMPGREREGGGG